MKPSLKKRILVIEDDKHIAEALELNLEFKGYNVHTALDGLSGLKEWKSLKPDLIVLDIMLPGMDGISVLRHIRLEDERIPILIISARGTEDDRVHGLQYGVDDYLAKPFNLDEFLLRVERLLLRGEWSQKEVSTPNQTPDIYRFGNNSIDFTNFTATCWDGETVRLTPQEAKLLRLFISNRGKTLPRGTLLEVGWGYSEHVSTRTLDNFIVRFRKYFEEDPKSPHYFICVRAVGYMFDDETEPS
jgi:two-component system, OmpR family, alkaline phosphatase synthesis response regulator PhoP